MPEPPDYHCEENRVAALLQAWCAGKKSPDDDAPEKLIYLLEHAYTPAELGFATLKGPDASGAAVLAAAARQSDTELHLALLTVEESGIAEYAGYESRRGRGSEPELEAGEADDRYERSRRHADPADTARGSVPDRNAAGENRRGWRLRQGDNEAIIGALAILSPEKRPAMIERRTWSFKAAEAERAHLAAMISRVRCDLDLTTNERGRPYTLVCIKNQASYDRRARQRKQDLEDVARIDQ